MVCQGGPCRTRYLLITWVHEYICRKEYHVHESLFGWNPKVGTICIVCNIAFVRDLLANKEGYEDTATPAVAPPLYEEP